MPRWRILPAVLAAYTSLRAVIAEHGALDPKVSWH